MNLGEMTAEWREDNRDTGTPPLFSDELLARLFSEAEEEGSIRKCLIRETVTIPIVVGDMELELAGGIFEVRTARIVEGDTSYWLSPSDRYEQDRLFIGWRTETAMPTSFIHDDKSLTLNRLVATDADLVHKCFRFSIWIDLVMRPERCSDDESDSYPRIGYQHFIDSSRACLALESGISLELPL